MRQVNIKELSKHLSVEMSDLPFAITKRGKVIGVMIAPGITQGTDLVKDVKEKLTEIIKKKKGTDITETTITTEETPTLGYTKSQQCRKKVK